MMRKKTLVLLCMSLFLLVALNGCQGTSARKPLTTPTPQKKTTQQNEMSTSERRVLASKLSKMAEQVEGVNRAAVVVADVGISSSTDTNPNTGDTNNPPATNNATDNTTNNDIWQNANRQNGIIVMVGLTLNQTAAAKDSNQVNSIKNMVMSKLKASDKRISQVLVTTDPNLIKRINDVAAGILEGKPIKTFEKDVNDINMRIRQPAL